MVALHKMKKREAKIYLPGIKIYYRTRDKNVPSNSIFERNMKCSPKDRNKMIELQRHRHFYALSLTFFLCKRARRLLLGDVPHAAII